VNWLLAAGSESRPGSSKHRGSSPAWDG
jgi:hypothetical protein